MFSDFFITDCNETIKYDLGILPYFNKHFPDRKQRDKKTGNKKDKN